VLNQALGALLVHNVQKGILMRNVKSSIARTAKEMCPAEC